MKVSLLFMAGMAVAVPTQPFRDWSELTRTSKDIVIVHCVKTPETEIVEAGGVVREEGFGGIKSDVEISFALKGQMDSGKSEIVSQYPLRQSEYYLAFANQYESHGFYQAYEPYRIISLGQNFDTNVLSGKTLDEQIQTLLQKRLNDLNRQMKAEQEEKARLESAFKK